METQISESAKLRLFIAVDIDDNIRKELEDLEMELQAKVSNAKWVGIANLHLTIKFLGDIDSADVLAIRRELSMAAAGLPGFKSSLAGIGAFSSPKKARIIWAGINKGVEKFGVLQRSIDSALMPLGFAGETRAFHPHVTLARLKEPTDISEALKGLADSNLGMFEVKEIVLYSSELTPKGPEYTVIQRFALGLA